MPYVDRSGRIVAKPVLAKASDFFVSLYFAIMLFVSTLFSVSSFGFHGRLLLTLRYQPAQAARLPPSNSVRNTQTGFASGNAFGGARAGSRPTGRPDTSGPG